MKIRMMIAMLVCLSTTAIAAKDKPHDWKEGKLTAIERRQASGSTETVFGATKRPTITFDYTIVVGDHFYIGSREADTLKFTMIQKDQPPIDLEINGAVKVAIEERKMYLTDAAGKEWILFITKHGIKEN